MEIVLEKVTENDIELVWKMQVEAFSDLLKKYQDYKTNPGAEDFDKVTARFEQPWTTYFFIISEGRKTGVVRVVDKKDGSRKRISPIWIMKEYRNMGLAQQAIKELEKIYGANNWGLDTILQEKGNCYLYEKMGYRRTGKVEKINLPKSNVVKLFFENGNTITVRPSGTEPKVKFYIGMKSKTKLDKSAADKLYEELKKALKI